MVAREMSREKRAGASTRHVQFGNAYLAQLDGGEGRCPLCDAGPVAWKAFTYEAGGRVGVVYVWCSSWRRGTHLSRVQLPDGVATSVLTDSVTHGMPSDIKFE